jgi:alpha-tubulin suppressor-like RCC1 family protein
MMKKMNMSITSVAAGGHHNMILTNLGAHVITWGANDYGQLGLGHQWDDPKPTMIPELRGIGMITAGLRHSFAVQDHGTSDLWAWGYNGYGELGLGDCDMRIQPTKVTAIKNTRIMDISTGDRHTVLVLSHKPMLVKENPPLKPFFAIAEVCAYANVICLSRNIEHRQMMEILVFSQRVVIIVHLPVKS